jgi:hypothetical protein
MIVEVVPISVPAPAAAWGYNTLTFADPPPGCNGCAAWSQSSELDINNTSAAGYNWYVNATFPNGIGGIPSWTPVTSEGTLTCSGVSGSSLTSIGTLAAVNGDLATLQDNTTSADTITINATDSQGASASQQQISVGIQ